MTQGASSGGGISVWAPLLTYYPLVSQSYRVNKFKPQLNLNCSQLTGWGGPISLLHISQLLQKPVHCTHVLHAVYPLQDRWRHGAGSVLLMETAFVYIYPIFLRWQKDRLLNIIYWNWSQGEIKASQKQPLKWAVAFEWKPQAVKLACIHIILMELWCHYIY